MVKETLFPVQYLRAVAALAVFYFHFCVVKDGPYTSDPPPIEKIGSAGVDLFFVISGFIMAMLVWNAPTTFSRFMFARFVRIVPLYWSATILVFAIALIAPSLLGSTTADPVQLLHSLLFIPYGIGTQSTTPILVVGWTLNYEMFFYVLVAVSAGFLNDRSLIHTSYLICIMAMFGMVFPLHNGYLEFYLNPIILEFPMGILVFHFWRLGPAELNRYLAGGLLAASIAAIAILFNKDSENFRFFFWGMPCAVLLFATLHFATLKNEWLKSIGDWSYSIYLLHVFVIMGFHKVVGAFFPLDALPTFVYFSLVVVTLIVLSAISYRCFEMPVQHWLKSNFKRAFQVSE